MTATGRSPRRSSTLKPAERPTLLMVICCRAIISAEVRKCHHRRSACPRPERDRLSNQTYAYGEVKVGPCAIGGQDLGRVTAYGQREATPIAERKTSAAIQ